MKIAQSLHRLGSSLVNCYLIEEAGLVSIIDAGLPAYWKDLPAELASMGRSLDDVRAVVLIHGDTDHIRFAERLRRERGVPVYVHELDAARACGEVKKPNSGWGPVKIGPLLSFLLYSARRGGLRIPPVAEVVTFGDGATLDVPGAPQVIHLPGHTPGSSALHAPGVDAVFVGDALTTRSVLTGDLGPRLAPFTLEPSLAMSSLARLDGLEVSGYSPATARRGQGACKTRFARSGQRESDGRRSCAERDSRSDATTGAHAKDALSLAAQYVVRNPSIPGVSNERPGRPRSTRRQVAAGPLTADYAVAMAERHPPDRGVGPAVASSFLAGLPPEAQDRLVAESVLLDIPAGSILYRDEEAPRTGVIVAGLVRIYLTSPELAIKPLWPSSAPVLG